MSATVEQEVTYFNILFPDPADLEDFAYHCQFARLGDSLTDYLRSLARSPEITLTKSLSGLLISPEDPSSLRSILFFLQAIGRPVSKHTLQSDFNFILHTRILIPVEIVTGNMSKRRISASDRLSHGVNG